MTVNFVTRVLGPMANDGRQRLAVDQLADVLTHRAQIATAVRAAVAGIEFTAFARGCVGDAGTAARFPAVIFVCDRIVLVRDAILGRPGVGLGHRHPQILEGQFELFDLALDLFRALPEGLLLQLGDPHTQRLDQQVVCRNVAEICAFSVRKATIIAFRTAGSSGKSGAEVDMPMSTTAPRTAP
jgi:hypothetical protein